MVNWAAKAAGDLVENMATKIRDLYSINDTDEVILNIINHERYMVIEICGAQ